jgi:transcriptional regulator GlxA family with amidase domain
MLCSGGVYSSMDLSLYLVEKFCGHDVALQCAKALLINMPRASQSGYAVLPLSRPHDDDKVRTAEAYMEKNYARDISIERVARDLNMSPRNFIRRFKSATGRLPGNYLQAMRVAVAKEMLEDGARSVQAVSTAVGYDDAAFFRELFKRCTGMTPGEYRENFTGISCLHPDFAGKRPRVASSRA